MRGIKQFFSKRTIGSLGAAGLVIDADVRIPQKPVESTILSEVADQTASRILDSSSNASKEIVEPVVHATPVLEQTITSTSQASTEIVQEATVLSSEANKVSESITIDPIPEPPPVPDFIPASEIVEQLNALGQPTFASLGLGGWTPIGLIQECFEYLNVTMGVPWWGAIALGNLDLYEFG